MTSVTAAECIECYTRPLNIVLSFMLILDIQIIKEQQILFPYTINQLMPFHSPFHYIKYPLIVAVWKKVTWENTPTLLR